MTAKKEHQIGLTVEKRSVTCSEGETILQATLAQGINHTHACGGQGECSTCRVLILDGLAHCSPRTDREEAIADKLNFPGEVRLACQTHITGDIELRRMILDQLDMDIVSGQFQDESGIAIGSQEQLTMLFIDVVNYTSLAERFPPYDIVHVLNRYYRLMNAIIKEHRGIISDVAGDGILAIFGTGQDSDNSVADALRAVRGMQEGLKHFNVYLDKNFGIEFGIRAGIHFGEVIVGPFDTGSMRKLAVIGDNVNYASRIESANKEFGTDLLLSQEAYDQIKHEYESVRVFETQLKGKTGQYRLYAPA
ncbi:MAG: adenylate/guanylate cyclase domain-containing protein [Saprospiraceae bacterium]|nr:adenylate/guanylate cyclase domain-containing protein [Saprospiraceae bacterium]